MRKRDVCIVMAAVVAAIALSAAILLGETVETGAWGLSFQQEGSRPQGTVSPENLKKYHAAYVGDGEQPVIYLTFDAGYENGYTGKILDVLKAHQAPATFFLVGNFIQRNPDLTRRMVEEGHTVGNHTMHHYDMSRLTDQAAFEKELNDLEELYLQTVGSELPRYYRPPQGVYSEENLKIADALGYRTVFWSLAYVDWNNDSQPTREQAFSKLIPRIHNGAVVLLHSTSQTNGEILDELLTKWESMGYRFAPLDELFSDA